MGCGALAPTVHRLAPAVASGKRRKWVRESCREHLSRRKDMDKSVSFEKAVAHIAMAVTIAACGGAGTSAATPGDQMPPPELRDVRYCEVIPSVAQGSTVLTSVYNTLGYNACPPAKWAALTESTVNREFGSQSARLNGPRHW